MKSTELINKIGRELGVDFSAPLSFPRKINTDYEQVFKNFVDTKAIQEIRDNYERPLSTVYIAMAFAQYIQAIDKKSVPNLPFTKYSIALVDFDGDKISDYLRVNRFLNHLRQNSHRMQISSINHNDFCTAFTNIRINGVVSYKAKGRHTLDNILHNEIKSSVFYKSFPEVLKTTRNNKPRKMLRLNTLLSRPNEWYCLINDKKSDLVLYVARAEFGTLVFRYEFRVPYLVFADASKKTLVSNTLLKKWKRIQKL